MIVHQLDRWKDTIVVHWEAAVEAEVEAEAEAELCEEIEGIARFPFFFLFYEYCAFFLNKSIVPESASFGF